MPTTLYAFTPLSPPQEAYPPYLSLNRQESGIVTLTVRSAGGAQGSIVLPTSVLLDLSDRLAAEAARQMG